jgi:hypothetical protein
MCKLRFVLFTLACLGACGGGGTRIDKAAKMDIDQRSEALTPSGQAFPIPVIPVPKPLTTGQWTQYKLVNEKGEPSFITYKVVGEEMGATWIEVANESYYGKSVFRMLTVVGDRMNPNTMEIRALKMKDKTGRVFEAQGQAIQSLRPMWQSSLNMLAVVWQGLPQETMNAIAGYFPSCFKAQTDANWGLWGAVSTSWMHPTVPISGLVKSAGINRATSVELIGFGEAGATTEIP